MSEKAIIEGVNCPKTRLIYRGIAMLTSVVWLTRCIVELLWPSLCSSWSTWKKELDSEAAVLALAAPFLYYVGLVVRSFYVPVPVPPPTINWEGWSFLVAMDTVSVWGISHYVQTIEWCIYGISFVAGLLAVMQLSWPLKDVHVQQVVYADFVLCLVGYLGYQRPVWLPCLLVAVLVLVNTLLFQGLLRLHPKDEDKSPCIGSISTSKDFASFNVSYPLPATC